MRNLLVLTTSFLVFPGGSDGKAYVCNAGDLGSIPWLGRSPGEGNGSPLQYSWASLVAQLVKNPPEMWETWVRSLGWEDALEKQKATHSSIRAWRIPWIQSMGSQSVGHNWVTFTFHFHSQHLLWLVGHGNTHVIPVVIYLDYHPWKGFGPPEKEGMANWQAKPCGFPYTSFSWNRHAPTRYWLKKMLITYLL